MTSFDTRKRDSDDRTGGTADPGRDSTPPEQSRPTDDRSARRSRGRVLGAAERDRMLEEAREIDFPVALRGYERAAVDRYVESVSRVIAELEMTASPEAAVRHALDEVSEETRDILQRAHQTADEITARSRAKADDRVQQAEGEAQQTLAAAQEAAKESREAAEREASELHDSAMREIAGLRKTAADQSETLLGEARREADKLVGSARQEAGEIYGEAEIRARELARSIDTMWRERRRLLDDIRAVGEQLVSMGELEARRFAHLAEALTTGDDNVAGDAAVIPSSAAPEIVKPD
jgi:cell division septum initiation protein DivIVA